MRSVIRTRQAEPGKLALDIDLRVGDVLQDADGVIWTVSDRSSGKVVVDRDPPSDAHHLTLPVRLISRA